MMPAPGLRLLAPLLCLVSVAAQQQPATPQQLRPMLLPQGLALPRADREITIDGSLIDWPKLPAMQLNDRRQLSGTGHGAWRGFDDASAVVFMMWDESALYVACTARDEWHRALDANTLQLTEIPAADSLMLTFDPERDTRANGPDPGRDDDREFWLADENGREVVQWDRLRGTARVLSAPARMVVVHDQEQGITSYEALIPWSEILPPGKQPAPGKVVDLQMVLNDFDEKTDSMPQTRVGWTFGMGPVVDPGILGGVMLCKDDLPLRGVVPEFPPKPSVTREPVEPPEYWRDLTAELLRRAPAVYDGKVTPQEAGGIERLKVLEKIDGHFERMPRVDWLELHQRINRRMSREVAGLAGRGLFRWVRERMHAVSKLGEDDVPAGSLRLFRLPAGGWMVRTNRRNLLVDPAGPDVHQWLWGGAQLCVLTQPLSMTRRNDELLLRMFTAKPVRPVLSHIVFHMPVVAMEKMPLVTMGESIGDDNDVALHVLGAPMPDGTVPYDCSYRVQIAGCPELLVAGPTLKTTSVDETWDVGVMIVSARNRAVIQLVKKVQPELVLFDDAFLPQEYANTARVRLKNLHTLQRMLLPTRSLLLAPGESWTVAAAAAGK
ncbi:MAG: hypothetical protein VXY92_07275 [Planctomycetota bacterium]|nr:hypothetical protein [Planctomycetota bacterium]